jgi:hypothetical protein
MLGESLALDSNRGGKYLFVPSTISADEMSAGMNIRTTSAMPKPAAVSAPGKPTKLLMRRFDLAAPRCGLVFGSLQVKSA